MAKIDISKPRPSAFTRYAARAVARAYPTMPCATVIAANTVGLIMTAPGIRHVFKGIMGRDYNLGGARILYSAANLQSSQIQRLGRPQGRSDCNGFRAFMAKTPGKRKKTKIVFSLGRPEQQAVVSEYCRLNAWAQYKSQSIKGASNLPSVTFLDRAGAFLGVRPLFKTAQDFFMEAGK